MFEEFNKLHSGIIDSPEVVKLFDGRDEDRLALLLFYHAIAAGGDWGYLPADPALFSRRVCPQSRFATQTRVKKCVTGLVELNLMSVFEGKYNRNWLYFPSWWKYQRRDWRRIMPPQSECHPEGIVFHAGLLAYIAGLSEEYREKRVKELFLPDVILHASGTQSARKMRASRTQSARTESESESESETDIPLLNNIHVKGGVADAGHKVKTADFDVPPEVKPQRLMNRKPEPVGDELTDGMPGSTAILMQRENAEPATSEMITGALNSSLVGRLKKYQDTWREELLEAARDPQTPLTEEQIIAALQTDPPRVTDSANRWLNRIIQNDEKQQRAQQKKPGKSKLSIDANYPSETKIK